MDMPLLLLTLQCVELSQSSQELYCLGFVFPMVTHQLKIHLYYLVLRVGAGLLETFFFSVLVLLTVLGFYLEPVTQKRSLFMLLTPSTHTFDTCLLVLAGPVGEMWKHSLLVWLSLYHRQAISRTRLSRDPSLLHCFSQEFPASPLRGGFICSLPQVQFSVSATIGFVPERRRI